MENRLTTRPRRPSLSPSPGTPGEGRGEGVFGLNNKLRPHPNPLPAYRARGKDVRAIGICVLGLLLGCTTNNNPPVSLVQIYPPAATQPDSPEYWRTLTQSLHGQQIVSDDSFAVIVPRDDIDLESEMGQIPISAGIASKFYFFRCPCGKVKLLGEFIVCDYEADDVLDALRAGKFSVISVAPILQNTRPSMESIRFQGEGEGPDLVKTLRDALDRIAHHHTTTNPDE
jgi:Domain of Unknown Function (DUF1259)